MRCSFLTPAFLLENMENLNIKYVPVSELKPAEYNPRKWDSETTRQLTESITRFGLVDPLIVNNSENRMNVVIGGHYRLFVAKQLGFAEVPVIYVTIPEIEKEKELNIRLNKNLGTFDYNLLSEYGESFLKDVGFSSEELDEIFAKEDMPEEFDLQVELEKLGINQITMQKGEVYQLGDSRLMVGDSTIQEDVAKLMGEDKCDLILTDPPYQLNYLKGKRHGNPTEGFGYKRDRKYLETDFLPPDFTQKWMQNLYPFCKENSSIIVFENWKNLRNIWDEMEKHWKVRNMIVWHLPNRTQGFASKYRFFSKHDIAMVGTSENTELNSDIEEELLQNEYETALFAISGKPYWEGYEKGKKYCPSDFIEFKTDDAKSSGQGVVFGTKPVEILLPYIKVLTRRDDLIGEPFGGSGSTLISAVKMKRRCYVMEKSPIYAEVIRHRWEKLTGGRAVKVDGK